ASMRLRRYAPVVAQLLALVQPEHGLRVADVDGEQHRSGNVTGMRSNPLNRRAFVVSPIPVHALPGLWRTRSGRRGGRPPLRAVSLRRVPAAPAPSADRGIRASVPRLAPHTAGTLRRFLRRSAAASGRDLELVVGGA